MQTGMASKRPIERPITAFVLSLLGGLFVTAGGVFAFLIGGSFYYYGYSPYLLYGAAGLVLGAGQLLGATLLYLLPSHRVAWGIMILVFGVSSIFSMFSPLSIIFFAGVPLSLVGGSLAIAWKPNVAGGFEDYRTCLTCGRHIRVGYPICPFCGTRIAETEPHPPPAP